MFLPGRGHLEVGGPQLLQHLEPCGGLRGHQQNEHGYGNDDHCADHAHITDDGSYAGQALLHVSVGGQRHAGDAAGDEYGGGIRPQQYNPGEHCGEIEDKAHKSLERRHKRARASAPWGVEFINSGRV